MADHAFPLKSAATPWPYGFHVGTTWKKPEFCDDPERRRWYLSFVVVGGGFTGVEMAGEINDLIEPARGFTATSPPRM